MSSRERIAPTLLNNFRHASSSSLADHCCQSLLLTEKNRERRTDRFFEASPGACVPRDLGTVRRLAYLRGRRSAHHRSVYAPDAGGD